MHKLLRRQLRKAQVDGTTDWQALLDLVDAAYEEVDRERRIMAHAYDVIRQEQGEAERGRAVAEAALLTKERLSVLGQLTATVAHELRNPLSAIRNSVFAMRESTLDAALSLDRPMQRIERNIKRCDSIIEDLLEYARVRDLETESVGLDAWLAEVLDDQIVPAGMVLARQLGAAGAYVALDGERFRRVMNNLLENAFQALIEDGGGAEMRVTVTTAAAEQAVIAVEDTGPGIPPQLLSRIFEPLFSTKSFGTGLGLPTVKQIVEQHQGTVAVTSVPGAGTRIELRLPILAGAALAPRSAA